jgi:hypothetical protein
MVEKVGGMNAIRVRLDQVFHDEIIVSTPALVNCNVDQIHYLGIEGVADVNLDVIAVKAKKDRHVYRE